MIVGWGRGGCGCPVLRPPPQAGVVRPEFVLSPVPVSPTVAQLLVLLAELGMLIVAQGQALSALSARWPGWRPGGG